MLLLVSLTQAADLGYVTSVQKVTGLNNIEYIKVGHSGNTINSSMVTGVASPFQYYTEFLIQLGSDDTYNNMQYATMLKCLSTHTLTIEAISGSAGYPIQAGDWRILLTNYKINNP